MALIPDWEDLSLAEQVAQMIVVRASGHLFDHQIEYPQWEPPAQQLRHWVEDLGVGGVILLGGNAAEVGLRTHQLQEWATLPLLIAADIEEGVGQRFAGATWFPPPMAIGAIAQQNLPKALTLAEQMGQMVAQEALAIGLNWVLAPVVDVNNNPANPVINVRAWGDTPDVVSQLSTAFLRGAQSQSVLTAAKHFPGHGDTAIDSHLELPKLPHTADRLAAIELPPFKAAIAAGVDAVMTAHLHIPQLDPQHPATLSFPILTELLRQQLGFEGLIVTDALIMGAITNQYGGTEAALLAIEAGTDILLMPSDPAAVIQAVCDAVETGRLSRERVQASFERIRRAKQKVTASALAGDTSHCWEQLPPPPIQWEQIAQPQVQSTATAILQASMRVYHPTPARLEILETSPCRNLILLDDILNAPFLDKTAPAILKPQTLGYQLTLIDRHTPKARVEATEQEPQPTLLQLFIRSNPFRNSTGLIQQAQDWIRLLGESHQLQALILYGSPYALDAILPDLPANIPYVFSYGQMPAAQTLALEALLSPSKDLGMSDRRFTD